jgi:hypothetical protein
LTPSHDLPTRGHANDLDRNRHQGAAADEPCAVEPVVVRNEVLREGRASAWDTRIGQPDESAGDGDTCSAIEDMAFDERFGELCLSGKRNGD